MARPKAKVPTRQYHISGQSVVRIEGKDFYLGPHDSPEAIARYAVLVAVYQQGGLSLPPGFDLRSVDERVGVLVGVSSLSTLAQDQTKQPILIRHITEASRKAAAVKFAKSPVEYKRQIRLCNKLDPMFGDVVASDFGPLMLREYREGLVQGGLARTYVNRLTNLVIGIFKNAVASELVDVSKVAQLKTLEPLRRGQTVAPETEEVEPANLNDVRQTAKHLSPVLKAMLRVQIATGMRPKEIFAMRPMDIDRSGDVWIYNLSNHKTSWAGKRKAVPLVGDARDAIIDYLARDPEAYLFSPAESVAWVRAKRTAERVTPDGPGRNKPGTNCKADPKRQPGTQYTAVSYCQAIQRAAKAANVAKWHPYQLRHLTATMIRAALGIEETQALLGHSKATMTAHYARESIEAATRAAKVAPKL